LKRREDLRCAGEEEEKGGGNVDKLGWGTGTPKKKGRRRGEKSGGKKEKEKKKDKKKEEKEGGEEGCPLKPNGRDPRISV